VVKRDRAFGRGDLVGFVYMSIPWLRGKGVQGSTKGRGNREGARRNSRDQSNVRLLKKKRIRKPPTPFQREARTKQESSKTFGPHTPNEPASEVRNGRHNPGALGNKLLKSEKKV